MARHKKAAPDDPIIRDDVTATVMREREPQGDRLYWRIRERRGSRRTLATGWWTREEAARAVDELRTTGTPPARAAREAAGRSVADLLAAWKSYQERRHEAGAIAHRSLAVYKWGADAWVEDIGDVLVSKLTRARVDDLLTDWQADGIAPRSCKQSLDVLKMALKWGEERGYIGRPPDLSRLSSLRIRDDEHVYNDTTPTRAQARAVLAAMEPGRTRDFVEILTLTGCRASEAAALRVGDVDLAAGTLSISGADPWRRKRGKHKPRRWPVHGDLRALLERLTEGRTDPTEYLIRDLPREVGNVTNYAIPKACEQAGVPVFSPHGLRRMVAMELLEVTDAKSVSKLTGHSVAILLRHYVRPTAERLRDVVLRSGIGSAAPGKVLPFRAQNSGTPVEDAE